MRPIVYKLSEIQQLPVYHDHAAYRNPKQRAPSRRPPSSCRPLVQAGQKIPAS